MALILSLSVPAWASASTRSAERSLRSCANAERAAAGLPALRTSPALGRAARAHARDMARRGYFDHTSPAGRGPGARVAARTSAFRRGVGENIAAGASWTTRRTCREWMASPGHRGQILDRSFTHVGAGYARGGRMGRYMVQVFGAAG